MWMHIQVSFNDYSIPSLEQRIETTGKALNQGLIDVAKAVDMMFLDDLTEEEKALMVHGTLKDFIAQIPNILFVRIHKSYVISLSKVEYTEGNQVKIGEKKLPVSLSFKEDFLKKLKS